MTEKRKIVLSVVLTAFITCAVTNAIRTGIDKISFVGTNSFQSKLDKINRVLKGSYLYDDYDQDKLNETALVGYVEGLDENYTHYYPAEEFTAYMDDMSESYVGIGVVVSINENEEIIVVAPFENSSAFEAGVKPGDILKKVDGEEFDGKSLQAAVNKIKGSEEGTVVKLGLVRDGKELEIDVTRKVISTKSVTSKMLDNNIGYVRISAFNIADNKGGDDTYTEFKRQVEELQADGMKKMIIDLRDNPGGELEVVCNIADMLLPEGLITYIEYKDGHRDEYKSDASETDMPMAVLINGNSASASEVLTGALKDYKKAEIIGETSFGKGIVQRVYPFSDGSGMSMTVAKYYSPNGVCIHGVGIEPDIEVKLDLAENESIFTIDREKDTQLNKAIEELNKQ